MCSWGLVLPLHFLTLPRCAPTIIGGSFALESICESQVNFALAVLTRLWQESHNFGDPSWLTLHSRDPAPKIHQGDSYVQSGKTHPGRIPHHYAEPRLPQCGAGHRVLQDSFWSDGTTPNTRAKWNHHACGIAD